MTDRPAWAPPLHAIQQAAVKAAGRDADISPGLNMRVAIAAGAVDGLWCAAWLAENDDPTQSLIGEVRRDPQLGAILVRADPVSNSCLPWVGVTRDTLNGYTTAGHDAVKGWPVIGFVPGTPAAEKYDRLLRPLDADEGAPE